MGFWNEFMDYNPKQVEFIGVEAGGQKIATSCCSIAIMQNWNFTWC